jgi:hypothetical protein
MVTGEADGHGFILLVLPFSAQWIFYNWGQLPLWSKVSPNSLAFFRVNNIAGSATNFAVSRAKMRIAASRHTRTLKLIPAPFSIWKLPPLPGYPKLPRSSIPERKLHHGAVFFWNLIESFCLP